MDPNAYVGTYEFECEEVDESFDKETNHELDRLVLLSNGRYSLVQGGSAKAISEAKGTWSLVPAFSSQPPSITSDRDSAQLDRSGYPIRVKKGHIYLGIDDDLGQYYAKK